MNNIFKYIAIGAVALMSTSCLELSPKDQLADPDLWGEPADFQTFANKFYDWLPNYGMIYADNVHCDRHSDLIRYDQGIDAISAGTYTVGESDGDYTGAYDRIRRCNLLIENSARYGGNPQDIRQAVGEAYFFRAWNYFQLLQKFGDVIIVRSTIDTDSPLLFAERDDRALVADFIIEDLKTAAEYLKPTADVEEGRVGSEGALGFLSRVGLFEGTWQIYHKKNDARGRAFCTEAADAARKVIDGKKFELFYNTVLGDASQKYMFILEDVQCNGAGLNKDANKEYIIKRCFDEALKPGGRNVSTEIFFQHQWVASKFADMYLCQDGLPIDKSPLFRGRDRMVSEWQNRDHRMRYTLCQPGDNFWNNDKSRIDWSGSDEEIAVAARRNAVPNGGTGYFHQKWSVERKVKDNQQSFDWPVLRYAEVLLNYAEATFEANGGTISDDDLNISLNLTRKRVNKEMPALTNAFAAANGLDMRTEIRRERTLELFQEGFRLDDLRRWKTAEVEMPMNITGIVWKGEWITKWPATGFPTDAEGRIVVESGRVFDQKHYLFPLPYNQLQLNPNLKQNPGW
ncbi:MAG: RagB/SusD family nutrient uptake outer membrane protein [Muribaculaceae bacterium]|nr:RagB/SusD family nutrient uptake outer membrane protein [Muribaculaceae bacterium]